MKKSAAFTLVEILLVVAILGLVSAGVLFNLVSSQNNQALSASASQFADMVRRAHVYALQAKINSKTPPVSSKWGVFNTGDQTYELRSNDGVSDKVESSGALDKSVKFTAAVSIWFEKTTGETASDVTIHLLNKNNQQLDVEIKSTGVVNVIP